MVNIGPVRQTNENTFNPCIWLVEVFLYPGTE